MRVTKRRAETRARLLEAAFTVFAAKGFGQVRIDEVCAAAGYTRGAFYSNFAGLDELFFALYDERAALIAAQVATALTGTPPETERSAVQTAGAERSGVETAGAERSGVETAGAIEAAIARTAATLLLDRDWLLVKTDFLLYAARTPGLATRLAEHRDQLRAAIEGRLLGLRDRLALPAAVPDIPAAARAVVAAYDGVTVQLLVDDDLPAARAWLTQLLTALLVR